MLCVKSQEAVSSKVCMSKYMNFFELSEYFLKKKKTRNTSATLWYSAEVKITLTLYVTDVLSVKISTKKYRLCG